MEMPPSRSRAGLPPWAGSTLALTLIDAGQADEQLPAGGIAGAPRLGEEAGRVGQASGIALWSLSAKAWIRPRAISSSWL